MGDEKHIIEKSEFDKLVGDITKELNDFVFGPLDAVVRSNRGLRQVLNPAFPFPRELRIGVGRGIAAVEFVGPEIQSDPNVPVYGAELLRHGREIEDFLAIDIDHLNPNRVPLPEILEDTNFLIGDAPGHLCDYFYDFASCKEDFVLNGFPDFGSLRDRVVLSNVSFLWSTPTAGLAVRHVDFLEVFYDSAGNIKYHGGKSSYDEFVKFVLARRSPKYQLNAHKDLNGFIHLINTEGIAEPKITKYIEEHPALLQLALGTHDLNPQIDLPWQYKTTHPDLKPDFMPKGMDGYSDILDFKLPKLHSKPMGGIPARRQPSYEVDSMVAQVNLYDEWCAQDVNRRWLQNTRAIRVMNPRKFVIAGRSDEFTAEDRQRLRKERNVTFFTYDEFIEMARFQIYRARPNG